MGDAQGNVVTRDNMGVHSNEWDVVAAGGQTQGGRMVLDRADFAKAPVGSYKNSVVASPVNKRLFTDLSMLMGSSTPQSKGISPINGVGPVRPLGDPTKVQQLQQDVIADTIELADSDRLMRRENSALMNADILGGKQTANELTQLRLQQ